MLRTLLLRLLCLLTLKHDAVAVSPDTKSFQPVSSFQDNSILCATDTPTASISINDVIGIPAGVPGDVVCGYLCTGFSNCSSYNYVIEQSAAHCDLYTFIPRSCVASPGCQHFQMARRHGSCLPVCDPQCAGECPLQGTGKCDSQCNDGWVRTSNFTCALECDPQCASGCTTHTSGKCDSQCNNGWILTSQNICAQCPAGFRFTASTGSCYRREVTTMTWTNAALACASYAVGGHLVFIDSAVEQTAITTLINNYGSCWWLGGQRATYNPAVFVWKTLSSSGTETSQPMGSFTQWGSGQPDNANNQESCMNMVSVFGYHWNDEACGQSCDYICELKLM